MTPARSAQRPQQSCDAAPASLGDVVSLACSANAAAQAETHPARRDVALAVAVLTRRSCHLLGYVLIVEQPLGAQPLIEFAEMLLRIPLRLRTEPARTAD